MTFLVRPGLWASIKTVQGTACLFTHDNPRGDGFVTYTALDYVFANRCGLTLSGAAIRFKRAELTTIRKAAQVPA